MRQNNYMEEFFKSLLSSKKILLSDGAMGTELQKRGMKPGACPEKLNVTHPELVQSIHKDYFDAGSDIVETNTFGSSSFRLASHQFEKRAKEFSKKAAENAKAVCPIGKFVAGSIGPTGLMLEPYGKLSIQKAYDAFAEQIEALAEGGVDLFFVETMMSIEEAETAVRAAKDRTNLPVAAAMTFNSGLKTIFGVDISVAVQKLTDAGADIIGSNCGRGFDEMFKVISEMKSLTIKPLLAQANAGLPELVDGKFIYKETPKIILPKVEKLLRCGVKIIGGCCGTSPQHIRAMRGLVDKANSQQTEKFIRLF
jgi:5-methyltetrahydrofolate--homocysteine methyltransferase